MITASDVRLRAGERLLFEDFSLELRPSEFVAILGPNGAGKTTLLRALAGVRAPDAGRIQIGDRDVSLLKPAERAIQIAHIAGDELFLDQLTVRDVVATGRYPYHRWWQWHEEERDDTFISQALRDVRMETFTHRRFDTLSSGERQRIWLALALAQQAPVLLLDEPTSHLDIRVAHEILDLMRMQVRNGKTIVCVLHDLNEASEFADRVLLLGHGRALAFDKPEAVLVPPLLLDAYGMKMEQLRGSSGALRVFPR